MPDIRAMPYAFAGNALVCRVLDVVVDGQKRDKTDLVDASSASMTLSGLESWSDAELLVRVKVDGTGLRSLVSEEEDPDETISMSMLISDGSARSRWSVPMSTADGEWQAKIRLQRHRHRGPVRCLPVAVRSIDGTTGAGLARRAGERVASGDPLTIWLFERPPMPGNAIPNQWENFAESELPELVKRSDCNWHLDLSDPDRPMLRLNEAVEGLKRILEVSGTHGHNARIRDAVIRSILEPVLTHLAIEAISTDGVESVDDLGGWRKGLLVQIARESKEGTEEHVIETWLRKWREVDHVAVLSELSAVIQRRLDSQTVVRNLIRDLEKGPPRG